MKVPLSNQICDMVTVARYLNVTLIVPELDKTSFWADPRSVFLSGLAVTLTNSVEGRICFSLSAALSTASSKIYLMWTTS